MTHPVTLNLSPPTVSVLPNHSDSSILKRIRNVLNTFFELIKGLLVNKYENLPNRGRMMTNVIQGSIFGSWSDRASIKSQANNPVVSTTTPDSFWDQLDIGTKAEGKLCIPFVVVGNGFMAVPHNVLITLNYDTKQIRYFDPKGKPSVEFTYSNTYNVQDLLTKVQSEMNLNNLGEWEIVENRQPHQKNTFSCGYHVICQIAVELGKITAEQYDHNNPRETVHQRLQQVPTSSD